MTYKILIFLFLCSLSLIIRAESDFKQWKKNPPVILHRGDLVFRRGHGLWTKFFINMSTREKRFSHVGLVVSVTNKAMIIHSEASDVTGIGDVHISEWDDFFKGSSECAVFRWQRDDGIADKIVACAERYKGVPFDNLFDMDETNKLYCSEMVRNAINDAVGTNLVGFTKACGRKVVAIDDLYYKGFIKVYDSVK